MSKLFIKYIAVKDGKLDKEATLKAFEKDVVSFWESEYVQLSAIQKNILDLFAKYPGVRLGSQAVVGMVCREMNISPEPNVYTPMAKKVETVLHGLRDAGILTIETGKNGGCRLVPKQATV